MDLRVLTLALETSLTSGSVAIIDEARTRQEIILPPETRSAQSLAPAIERVLRETGTAARDIALIATTAGPGSFTGLRVGVMTAKTLAFAWKCAVIGVDTLEVLARQAVAETLAARVHAVMDGQRRQLFAATFQVSTTGELTAEGPAAVVDRAVWLAELRPGDWVTGPGLAPLLPSLPPGVIAAAEEVRAARASMVGRVGLEHFLRGRRDDWRTLAPRYLRPSAAEEKRAARDAGVDLSSG